MIIIMLFHSKLLFNFSFAEPVYISAPVIEYTDMTSSSYATDLLRMLSSLYEEKICCDVVLSAGRFQTQAHKVVLIASSGFFKSLLLDKDLPFNDVITLSSEHLVYLFLESIFF